MSRALLLLTLAGLPFVTSCGSSSNGAGPPDAASSTIVVPDPFGAPADDAFELEIQAFVRDANGRAVSGRTVEFAVTGDGVTLTQPTAFTDSTGLATGSLRASVPGVKTISATVEPASMTPVPITATASATFVVDLPGQRFVSPDGDDTNSGDHALDAWASIDFAMSQAQPGDQIVVAAGTYAENPVLTNVAPNASPITLQGDPHGRYTGRPGPVVVDAQGGDFGIQLDGVENLILRGFTVVNAAPPTSQGGAIWVTADTSTNFALLENVVYDNLRGIVVENGVRFHLEGNVVSNNTGPDADGIFVTSSTNGIVTRNLVYGNAGRGIVLGSGASTVFVSYNTVYGNTGVQVRAVAGTLSQIDHNVISDGTTEGLLIELGAFALENNNVLFGHGGNDFFSGAGAALDASSQVADPLLVDPAGADGLLGGAEGADDRFTLDPASPAVDAGAADANATFFAFGGFARGMSTREDGVADGAGTDGALVNVGWHERDLDVTALEPLASGDLRLTHAVDGDPAVKTSRFDGTKGTWDAALDATPTNTDHRWVLSKRSPLEPAEAYAALTENGTFTNLFVRTWDGTRWSEETFFNQFTSPYDPTTATQRAFDLEYESTSGDLMVVRGNETDIPVFRVFSDGRWSADQDVYSSSPSGSPIRWIELASDPNSDRMCVVCLDEASILTASVWDGDSWDTTHETLDVQIATLATRPFDVVFESLSGDLMVVWGHTNVIEEARFSTRASGSGTWVPGLMPSIDSLGAVVRLAASPTSDQLVIAVAEGFLDDDCSVAIWDGNDWFDEVELDSGFTGDDQVDIGVGWIADGTRAVVIFQDDDAVDSVDFARWRPGGWNIRPDVTVPGMTDPVAFQSVTNFADGTVQFLVQDDAGAVWHLVSDGDDLEERNGGVPVITGLSGTGPNRPFALTGRP